MISVLATSDLKETAVNAVDWFLSCQEDSEQLLAEFLGAFKSDSADDGCRKLLTVVPNVFSMLAEAHKRGFKKIYTKVGSERTESAEPFERSFSDIFKEAEDFFACLVLIAASVDAAASEAALQSPAGVNAGVACYRQPLLWELLEALLKVPAAPFPVAAPTTQVGHSAPPGAQPDQADDPTVVEGPPPVSFPELRIRTSLHLCEYLRAEAGIRFPAAFKLVKFAADYHLFEMLATFIREMPDWIDEGPVVPWATSQELYDLVISQVRLQEPVDVKVLEGLLEHSLKTFDAQQALNPSEGISPRCSEIAVELLKLRAKKMVFDASSSTPSTLQYPSVQQQLQNSAHAPLVELVEIFERGILTDFDRFREKYGSKVFENYGISEDQALGKIRLLVLASLAADCTAATALHNRTLSLKTVSDELRVPCDEAERLIAEAINLDILDARIDQLASQVIIRSAWQRSFGLPEWQKLQQRLIKLNSNITEVLSLLAQ